MKNEEMERLEDLPGKNSTRGNFIFQSKPDNGRWSAEAHVTWKRKKHSGLIPLMNDYVLAFLGNRVSSTRPK